MANPRVVVITPVALRDTNLHRAEPKLWAMDGVLVACRTGLR